MRSPNLLLLLALAACHGGTTPPAIDSASFACTRRPADFAACTTNADCTWVAQGCYCGAQPVVGVAVRYATSADACEVEAAQMCALGCANEPGAVAQDGTHVSDINTISVRCDLDSAGGTCTTFVP